MEDDAKNRVNAEKETVKLSQNLEGQLRDGLIVSRLLHEMQRTYMTRTGAKFDLATQAVPGSREMNWESLVPQLRQFGVQINETRARRLKQGDDAQLKSLLTTLFEIDTSPMPSRIQAPSLTSQSNILKLDQIENNSNLTRDALNQNLTALPALRSPSNSLHEPKIGSISHAELSPVGNYNSSDPDQQQPFSMKIRTQIPTGRNNAVEGAQSMLAAQISLSPRIQLDDLGRNQIKQNTRTLRQSHLASLRGSHGRNSEFTMPDQLDETLTSAQFILKSLMGAFDMSQKQAVGLLSDNHRYLFHLCIKGLKGGSYDQVVNWYNSITPHAAHLVSLLELETVNQAEAHQAKPPLAGSRRSIPIAKAPPAPPVQTLPKTLNILKGGLDSQDEHVARSCLMLFEAVIIELNLCGGDIVGQTWDWLVSDNDLIEDALVRQSHLSLPGLRQGSQVGLKQNKKAAPPLSAMNKSPIPKNKKGNSAAQNGLMAPKVEDNEFLETLKQSGLRGLIQAFQTHESVQEYASLVLLNLAKFNAAELFTEKLPQMLGQWCNYVQFCQVVFLHTHKTDIGVEILEQNGVLRFWAIQSLKVVESPIDVTLDDRISSLVLLTEIWLNCTVYIDQQIMGSGPAILNILKRAARDVKQTLSVVAIELMFRLLEHFAKSRHPMAPTLYKTLTFILVEFYWEIEIRELMLNYFVNLFKRVETIPVAILCEPLLKQVQISQYHATSFNIFDFEFFQAVAYHRKLNMQTALLLMEALTKIALSSIFFAKLALSTLRSLIMRFSRQPELFSHWKESFRQMLSTLVSIETTLAQHALAAKEDTKNFYNRLSQQTRGRRQKQTIRGNNVSEDFRLTEAEAIAVKTNQRLLVNVCEKVIELGNDLLNEELRQQLIDSFVACEQQLSVHSKPMAYLLTKYGVNVDQMISHKLGKIPGAPSSEDDNAILVQELASEPQYEMSPPQGPTKHMIGRQLAAPQQRSKSRSVSKSPTKNLAQRLPSPQQRQVETAHELKKSGSQPKIRKLRANRFSVKNSLQHGPASAAPQSVSVARQGAIELYMYSEVESATNILRYRHFLKKHLKLNKDIFARYDGNSSKQNRVPKSMRTFDTAKQLNQVMSSTSILRMVKELDLMPQQGNFLTSLRIRQDIPALIKLINRQPGLGVTSKLPELSFDGFVEFLLQYAHQLWNISPISVDKQLLAIELSEKLLDHIKTVNEEKRLMLPKRHFHGRNQAPLGNREEQAMLQLLNEKVAKDPDYVIPDGFKKVPEVVIEEAFVVPAEIEMSEEEKIALELLDEIFSSAVPDMHILQAIPVTKTVMKVVVDQDRVLAEYASALVAHNKRSLSVGSQLSSKDRSLKKGQGNPFNDLVSRRSGASIEAHSISVSPNNRNKKINFLSSPQIVSGKSSLSASFKNKQVQLRPELRLGVIEASLTDRPLVGEVASAFEEMLLAVEEDQTEGFSLVENDKQASLNELITQQGRNNPNRRSHLRSQVIETNEEATDDDNGPRYLSRFKSKRTKQREQEVQDEKAAREKPISSAERRDRARIVRESLTRHERYIEIQKKQFADKEELKKREEEQAKQNREKAKKHKLQQKQKVKEQLREFNEKREKEKQVSLAKVDEEKKIKQKEANILMRRKQSEIGRELERIRENAVKAKSERKMSIERQGQLPKVNNHHYQRREKPAQPVAADQEATPRTRKPPIPTPSVTTKRSINASKSPRPPISSKQQKPPARKESVPRFKKEPLKKPEQLLESPAPLNHILQTVGSVLDSVDTLNNQNLPPRPQRTNSPLRVGGETVGNNSRVSPLQKKSVPKGREWVNGQSQSPAKAVSRQRISQKSGNLAASQQDPNEPLRQSIAASQSQALTGKTEKAKAMGVRVSSNGPIPTDSYSDD